jgi:glycosyltransferase involved in cell wall biosynthesis
MHDTATMRRHIVEVVCLDEADAPWLADCAFPVHHLGHGRSAYAYHAGLIPWLRSNARRYDAVIVHGLWLSIGRAVRLGLRHSGTPYYVYPHGMLDPYFKHAYPRKHLKKLIYWLLAERQVLAAARRVCFTCEEERLLARRTFPLARYREAVVSFGAADPPGDPSAQRAAFLTAFPQLRDRRLFLFLGRIHPKKGCDLLIEALANVASLAPDLHLVIAGPDADGWQAALHRRAEALGIAQRITWTGMLRGEHKWGAFHAAEVFVLPSHQENFGVAVAEALACSVPVLITNRVNIWREIAADEAGIVSNDDPAGIEALLRDWLTTPRERRSAMGLNARRCFLERFEANLAAARLLEVLTIAPDAPAGRPVA